MNPKFLSLSFFPALSTLVLQPGLALAQTLTIPQNINTNQGTIEKIKTFLVEVVFNDLVYIGVVIAACASAYIIVTATAGGRPKTRWAAVVFAVIFAAVAILVSSEVLAQANPLEKLGKTADAGTGFVLGIFAAVGGLVGVVAGILTKMGVIDKRWFLSFLLIAFLIPVIPAIIIFWVDAVK